MLLQMKSAFVTTSSWQPSGTSAVVWAFLIPDAISCRIYPEMNRSVIIIIVFLVLSECVDPQGEAPSLISRTMIKAKCKRRFVISSAKTNTIRKVADEAFAPISAFNLASDAQHVLQGVVDEAGPMLRGVADEGGHLAPHASCGGAKIP